MSSENPSPGRDCASLAQDMHELALGILTGRERAVALEHLDHCSRCRAEVDRLSLAADSILQMAPRAEPPVGFELRLFEHLGLRPTPRRPLIGRRVPANGGESSPQAVGGGGRWAGFRRRPLLALAAALFAVVLAFGGGVLAGSKPTHSRVTASGESKDVYWGPLVAPGGHTTGRFVLIDSARTNPWLYMSILDPGGGGTATCRVLLANDKVMTAGTFWLGRGNNSWAVRLPAGSSVKATWVMTDGGTLVGSARIPA